MEPQSLRLLLVGCAAAVSVVATVTAGGEELRADTRGRRFLAALPELDASEAQAVVVDSCT